MTKRSTLNTTFLHTSPLHPYLNTPYITYNKRNPRHTRDMGRLWIWMTNYQGLNIASILKRVHLEFRPTTIRSLDLFRLLYIHFTRLSLSTLRKCEPCGTCLDPLSSKFKSINLLQSMLYTIPTIYLRWIQSPVLQRPRRRHLPWAREVN